MMPLVVAPLGDAIAAGIARLVIPLPSRAALSLPAPPAEPSSEGGPAELEPETSGALGPSVGTPRRIASRAATPRREAVEETRDAGARGAAPSDAPKVTIVVPASVVTRAIERRDVGATNALAPDGTPLGARLAGVSKYRTGLRDGDVVVSVAGTPTPTVEAMVAIGLSAASGGATRLSGRVARADGTYAVVLELPK